MLLLFAELPIVRPPPFKLSVVAPPELAKVNVPLPVGATVMALPAPVAIVVELPPGDVTIKLTSLAALPAPIEIAEPPVAVSGVLVAPIVKLGLLMETAPPPETI